MTALIDHTHDPSLVSWVESANIDSTDFPVQNLPFGRFRLGTDPSWRIGVAIGELVLDLRGAGLIDHADMARLMAMPPDDRRALRCALSKGLSAQGGREEDWRAHLYPQHGVTLGLPCDIRDYTDFYSGIHHATAVGRLLRPEAPLLPNYKWVPIGYHGRASTILVSGQDFRRPKGQFLTADSDQPLVGPCQRLDFELELGFVIGRANALGHSVPIGQAQDYLFGVALFNDWSARDIQAWEYQPLGPFLSKSFASTLSPWLVTFDALAPFQCPLQRVADAPQALPYLNSPADAACGALNIELEVLLQTQAMRLAGQAGDCISRSNAAQAAYWTPAQLVAHHTINGCALSAGDLFGSGTLSGPEPAQAGSLLELTQGGKVAIHLSNGERRVFLLDGDSVKLKGYCSSEGFRRIGFGDCVATVLPADFTDQSSAGPASWA